MVQMKKNNFKDYYECGWSFDGMSALSIYGVYTQNYQGNKHPYDPDDLTRCFQCLRMITSSEKVELWKEKIKAVCDYYSESKEWKWIYDNFEELYKMYFDEYDTNRMIKTYTFMQNMNKNK